MKHIKAFFIFLFAVAAVWFGASQVAGARRKRADNKLKEISAQSKHQVKKVQHAKRRADFKEVMGQKILQKGKEKLDDLQNGGNVNLAAAGNAWSKRVRNAKLRKQGAREQ